MRNAQEPPTKQFITKGHPPTTYLYVSHGPWPYIIYKHITIRDLICNMTSEVLNYIAAHDLHFMR